ncbi:MAG: bifunctional oligoribonuclease/PAP phosphatase NrnA [Kiritimatiellaeota bacterium]|nr:bifunctional oligoribonuclease/PAP phosphatase NrnA [Kiritimatiellota bacterium]
MPTKSIPRQSGLAAVAETLSKPGKFLVTGHLRPDGDAIGSALALTRLLNQAGHRAFFTAFKTQLGRPGFLEGCGRVVRPEDAARKRYDAWIALDCGTAGRLPEPLVPHAARARVVNIDHHATNTRFGAVNWVDPKASSTSELVWRLARRMGWPLDRAAAEALWVGLVTDTGRFAHEHVKPAALRFGADLLRHGVRTSFIDDRVYTFVTPHAMALKRRAHKSFETWFDDRVALISLTRGDFRETRTAKADAEDFIEIPRSLSTARVALFFYESESLRDNATRLGIRTRAPLDATRLAARFNGGGHVRAAGCTLEMKLAEAMAAVKKALAECYGLHDLKHEPPEHP